MWSDTSFAPNTINTNDSTIFTVTTLTSLIKQRLETEFPAIWVEGEVSNFASPGSGHCYFTLKDAGSQIKCAFFKGQQRGLNFPLNNGLQILAKARVSLYQPRGDFQLIIETVTLAGEGKLRLAFEQLKQRLNAERLFAAEFKKSLPLIPKQIGLITSPTGAAIRDMLSVLGRRCPLIPIIIYPSLVQGEKAAEQIVAAIILANTRAECDVLIVARGGGSLEDLWPFNEEIVARAIFHSAIPIISGVGHEIDFTIADFVADQRAATPSAAAELVSPDQLQWLNKLRHLHGHLLKITVEYLRKQQEKVGFWQQRLRHPLVTLRDKMQMVDQLSLRLQQLIKQRLLQKQQFHLQFYYRLQRRHPEFHLQLQAQQLPFYARRLQEIMLHSLSNAQKNLRVLQQTLMAYNPLAVLERGYAIIADTQGHILKTSSAIAISDKITATLAQGRLICEVKEIQ